MKTGDEPHKPDPIDARVSPGDIVNGRLQFSILLVGDPIVTDEWSGYFTADKRKLPSTDFKILQVNGHRAVSAIASDKLPSETVRLFAPGYSH